MALDVVRGIHNTFQTLFEVAEHVNFGEFTAERGRVDVLRDKTVFCF